MIKAIVTLAMSIFVLSTPILNIAIMEYWLNLGVATLIAQIGILALWIYFTKNAMRILVLHCKLFKRSVKNGISRF